MPETPSPHEQPPVNGKAIASLVLGVVSLPLSLFTIGALSGILGILLGTLHLRSANISRAMAWWGISLSGLGTVASIALLVTYIQFYQAFMDDFDFYDEDTMSQWEGVIAPDITVTTTNGDTIQLSEAKGKRVIIDIWATWCPPCIEEIPHFNVLRNEISEDDLLIVGISEEDRDTVLEFMENNAVDYPIIADGTDLPDPYGAISAYPTTFFIDRNGVIQNIIVGYEELDVLREYATAPDFEGEPLTEPAVPQSTLVESDTMLTPTQTWSATIPNASAMCTGDWDEDGFDDLLIVDNNRLHVINNEGKETESIKLPGSYALIDFGVHATEGPRLLGYDNWGNSITVVNGQGKKLWTYKSMMGINGAHWGDFDGDGTDEMIAGMNGGGGLHGISAKGKKLWRNKLGNVWNQSVIPAGQGGEAVILATEAGGTIRIFDSAGKKIRTINPRGSYYSPLIAAEIDDAGTRQILAIGNEDVVACDLDGKVQWTTTVGEDHAAWRDTTFAVGDIDGDGTKEWAFIDANGELVVVSPSGEKRAFLPNGKKLNEFAILPMPDQTALLITLQSDKVHAYAFVADEISIQ